MSSSASSSPSRRRTRNRNGTTSNTPTSTPTTSRVRSRTRSHNTRRTTSRRSGSSGTSGTGTPSSRRRNGQGQEAQGHGRSRSSPNPSTPTRRGRGRTGTGGRASTSSQSSSSSASPSPSRTERARTRPRTNRTRTSSSGSAATPTRSRTRRGRGPGTGGSSRASPSPYSAPASPSRTGRRRTGTGTGSSGTSTRTASASSSPSRRRGRRGRARGGRNRRSRGRGRRRGGRSSSSDGGGNGDDGGVSDDGVVADSVEVLAAAADDEGVGSHPTRTDDEAPTKSESESESESGPGPAAANVRSRATPKITIISKGGGAGAGGRKGRGRRKGKGRKGRRGKPYLVSCPLYLQWTASASDTPRSLPSVTDGDGGPEDETTHGGEDHVPSLPSVHAPPSASETREMEEESTQHETMDCLNSFQCAEILSQYYYQFNPSDRRVMGLVEELYENLDIQQKVKSLMKTGNLFPLRQFIGDEMIRRRLGAAQQEDDPIPLIVQLYSVFCFCCKFLRMDTTVDGDKDQIAPEQILRTATASRYGKAVIFLKLGALVVKGKAKLELMTGDVKLDRKIATDQYEYVSRHFAAGVGGDVGGGGRGGVLEDGEYTVDMTSWWIHVTFYDGEGETREREFVCDLTLGSGFWMGLNWNTHFDPSFFLVPIPRALWDHSWARQSVVFCDELWNIRIPPTPTFLKLQCVALNRRAMKMRSFLYGKDNAAIYRYAIPLSLRLEKAKVLIYDISDGERTLLEDSIQQSFIQVAGGLCLVFVRPRQPGTYRIRIQMKDASEVDSFLTPLVASYILVVRHALDFGVSMPLTNVKARRFRLLHPLQRELKIDTSVDLAVVDTGEIDEDEEEEEVEDDVMVEGIGVPGVEEEGEGEEGETTKEKGDVDEEGEGEGEVEAANPAEAETEGEGEGEEAPKPNPTPKPNPSSQATQKPKPKPMRIVRAAIGYLPKNHDSLDDDSVYLQMCDLTLDSDGFTYRSDRLPLILPSEDFFSPNSLINVLDETKYGAKLVLYVEESFQSSGKSRRVIRRLTARQKLEEDYARRRLFGRDIQAFKILWIFDLHESFGSPLIVRGAKIGGGSVGGGGPSMSSLSLSSLPSPGSPIVGEPTPRGAQDKFEEVLKLGPIWSDYVSSFALKFPRDGLIEVNTGERFRVALYIPAYHFLTIRWSSFSQPQKTPFLVEFDPETKVASSECYFLYPGTYLLHFFALPFAVHGAAEVEVGCVIVVVKGDPEIPKQQFLRPILQSVTGPLMILECAKAPDGEIVSIEKMITCDDLGALVDEAAGPNRAQLGSFDISFMGSSSVRVFRPVDEGGRFMNALDVSSEDVTLKCQRSHAIVLVRSVDCYAFDDLDSCIIKPTLSNRPVQVDDETSTLLIYDKRFQVRGPIVIRGALSIPTPVRFGLTNRSWFLKCNFFDFAYCQPVEFVVNRSETGTYDLMLSVPRAGVYRLSLSFMMKALAGTEFVERPGPSWYVWFLLS